MCNAVSSLSGMVQIYRIYANDRRIIVTNEPKNAYPPDTNKINLEKLVPALTDLVNGNDVANSVLFTPAPEKIMDGLTRELLFIEAGGGLVKDGRGRYLFIFRHGRWDLPKGKLEEGEQPEQGSVREVEEECGIRVGRITGPLVPTWHAYLLKGRLVLKKTYWFRMEADGDGGLKPQREEGITEARWFFPGGLGTVRENTYPLVEDVIDAALPGE